MKELAPTIGQSLSQNRKARAGAIVYEITTQQSGLPFGIAMADIQQSEAHFHNVTLETYTVVQGDLEVSLDGSMTGPPDQPHIDGLNASGHLSCRGLNALTLLKRSITQPTSSISSVYAERYASA